MARAGTTMHRVTGSRDAVDELQIEAALTRLRTSRDLEADLGSVLDIAIGITGADMGTLQKIDEADDSLRLVVGRGLSTQALNFLHIVRRDTNTTCAAALTQRMRVFVEDVSTSYLFVGTRELEMLTADGIAAAQSTPLISSNGRLWGVLTTHFRQPQKESAFDPTPLDRLAVQIADSLEERNTRVATTRNAGRSAGGG
jgi:GAF domain-containing protein